MPAAVQVEAFAQQVEAHHDALAVPAGATLAPRRRPRRLAGLGELPQHEVRRVALVAGAEHLAVAAAGQHVVEALVDEQAVVLHRLDAEVHAVVGGYARPMSTSSPIIATICVDVLRGVRHVGGPGDVELAHRLEPHRLALRGDLLPRPLLAVGPIDDAVVDVGDVADQPTFRPAPLR
jgi:hypothetical protein